MTTLLNSTLLNSTQDIDCEWFNGHLDELRFSKGLVVDQDLLGKVGAAYWTVAGYGYGYGQWLH